MKKRSWTMAIIAMERRMNTRDCWGSFYRIKWLALTDKVIDTGKREEVGIKENMNVLLVGQWWEWNGDIKQERGGSVYRRREFVQLKYHKFEMLDHPWGEVIENFSGLPDPFSWFLLQSTCCWLPNSYLQLYGFCLTQLFKYSQSITQFSQFYLYLKSSNFFSFLNSLPIHSLIWPHLNLFFKNNNNDLYKI